MVEEVEDSRSSRLLVSRRRNVAGRTMREDEGDVDDQRSRVGDPFGWGGMNDRGERRRPTMEILDGGRESLRRGRMKVRAGNDGVSFTPPKGSIVLDEDPEIPNFLSLSLSVCSSLCRPDGNPRPSSTGRQSPPKKRLAWLVSTQRGTPEKGKRRFRDSPAGAGDQPGRQSGPDGMSRW